MKIDKDYIAQLTLFEISGKIGEDEKAHLHKLIAENGEYHALYTELYMQFPETKLQQAREHLRAEKVWTDIQKRGRSYAMTRRIQTVAAFLILIIGTGLYLFINNKMHSSENTIVRTKDHITLQLASGEQVDLSKNIGRVKVGKTILNNDDNQLTYGSDHPNGQLATLIVPPGKNYMIRLVDGTEIQLNADTRLEFPMSFSGNSREVSILGEAYIKVAPSASKPFLVHLPGSTVQVLGTEFNVNAYDSGLVKVALVNGAVSMKHKRDSTILKPGFEIAVNENAPLTMEKFDVEDVLSWRDGVHLFNAASIQEVAKLIHRFYGINVQVDALVGTKKPFTGSLNRNKPVQNFLEGLKFSEYLDYHFDKDSTLHIK
jgi:transmembrane sensor